MLFHSVEFAIFLPVAFSIYWLLDGRIKAQNACLVLMSYVFYGWWDWRFLLLIIFSSSVDFILAHRIQHSDNDQRRKLYLWLAVCTNLLLLSVFKYYNFFIESFANAYSFFGHEITVNRLDIILPVGISFYTFQTMSYSIDVYRRRFHATKDLISFFAFVGFFPQLVAGPIERASNLLPQLQRERKFDYHKSVDGIRQILWGLFKKMVIADNCAVIVDAVFADYTQHHGGTLFAVALLFTIQLYCDFSGYSDIAIGTARLFGIHLKQNFAFPVFSKNIVEFWQRWHISLMTWLRDYPYKWIRDNDPNRRRRAFNVIILFILCGFWHGANWSFIIWGMFNGLWFAVHIKTRKFFNQIKFRPTNRLNWLINLFKLSTTFALISYLGVLFRSDDIHTAFNIMKTILSTSLFMMPDIRANNLFWLIAGFLFVEWIQRKKQHALEFDSIGVPTLFRWSAYLLIILSIAGFGKFSGTEYVYFIF